MFSILTSAVNVSISVRKSLKVLRTKAAATTGARLVLSARDRGSHPFRSKIHPWTVNGGKCVYNKMMKIPLSRTLVLKLVRVIVLLYFNISQRSRYQLKFWKTSDLKIEWFIHFRYFYLNNTRSESLFSSWFSDVSTSEILDFKRPSLSVQIAWSSRFS